jgi:hypothetical protein
MRHWGKTTAIFTGISFNGVDGLWIMIEYALTATFANSGKISYPRINTRNSIRGLYKYSCYNTILWQLPTLKKLRQTLRKKVF